MIFIYRRAGDGIRTHEMVPWEGTALPLGHTRIERIIAFSVI
jgi:hypothetical protein